MSEYRYQVCYMGPSGYIWTENFSSKVDALHLVDSLQEESEQFGNYEWADILELKTNRIVCFRKLSR